jgi:serine/threonine-protein phosphatase 6 regulatory ankyrin repeat subunit B
MLLENKNIEINQTTKYGYTALMLASIKGHKEIVKMLLAKEDIDINQTGDGGSTALMCASAQRNQEIVKMLLEHPDIIIEPYDDEKQKYREIELAEDSGQDEIADLIKNT